MGKCNNWFEGDPWMGDDAIYTMMKCKGKGKAKGNKGKSLAAMMEGPMWRCNKRKGKTKPSVVNTYMAGGLERMPSKASNSPSRTKEREGMMDTGTTTSGGSEEAVRKLVLA
jgi:hypothetical protein